MEKPTKLILDYSTWRSGKDGFHKVGEGDTSLLNKEGFMCCVGQWMLQCGYKKENLLDSGTPLAVGMYEEDNGVFFLSKNEIYNIPHYVNSPLVREAIYINDDIISTTERRISLLQELLAKEGIELEVINQPK